MNDETVMEFPCDFPIKTMGKDSPEFIATARSLIEKHAGPIDDDAVRTAQSSNGNFVSVTVTISASSRQQLDDIYQDLTAHDDVLMAL